MRKRMSASSFAKNFSEIAADNLESSVPGERDERISALKSRISKSGRDIHPTTSRGEETLVIHLSGRSRG